MATNILSDRLKFLVEEEIFEQVVYQERPKRFEYKLTEKGAATFPYFVTLLQWGDKWCDPNGNGKPMRLTHDSCGHSLHGKVICSECRGPLKAQEVDFSLGEASTQKPL